MWEEPSACQIREPSIEGGVRVTITSLSSQGWCVLIFKAQDEGIESPPVRWTAELTSNGVYLYI